MQAAANEMMASTMAVATARSEEALAERDQARAKSAQVVQALEAKQRKLDEERAAFAATQAAAEGSLQRFEDEMATALAHTSQGIEQVRGERDRSKAENEALRLQLEKQVA